MNRSSSGLYNTVSLVFVVLTILVFACTIAMLIRIIPAPGSFSPRSQSIPPTVVLPTSTVTPTPSPTDLPTETPLPTKTPQSTFTPVPQVTPSPRAQFSPSDGPRA